MRAVAMGFLTWFLFSATVALAADPPGAASLEDLTKKVIAAIDGEDYPAITALLIPPPVKQEEHAVNVAWYEEQRANIVEIAKAHRQLLAERKQLPLKETVVTQPRIPFVFPPTKNKYPNGKEIEYGNGRVAGPKGTVIEVFGVAAGYEGRWYLHRLHSLADEPRINKIRGVFGSKLPIQQGDKSYPLPEGWVVPDQTSLLPGMPVQYFDTRSAKFKPAEFLSGQPPRPRVLYLPGKDGKLGETHQVHWYYVIAAVETLKRGEKDPQAFKPSVRLLSPDSDVLLPEDLFPITPETPLVLGTPIKEFIRVGRNPGWETRIVVEPMKKDSVRVMHKDWHRWSTGENLTRYAIEKSVLERLQQPDAAQEYEPLYVQALEQGARQMIADDVKTYSLTLPHPDGYVPLPENEFVARGTRLLVEETDHRTWKTGTALVDSKSGPLVLVWDGSTNYGPQALRRSSMLMFDRQAVKPSPGTFEVVLLKSPKGDIRVAKAITEIVGVDLKDALEILREAPITLRKNLTAADAEKLQHQLEAAGATAKAQPTSTPR